MKVQAGLLFFVGTLYLISCKNSAPKTSRIFIVQKIILDNGPSLFWFKDEQNDGHKGINYFQITKNDCDLSVDKANAHCSSPVQAKIFQDTIYIYTRTPLVLSRSDSWYTLKEMKYSPEVYDSSRAPDPSKQFFLDSLCPPKK